MTMRNQLLALIERYKQLGIDSQIDYNKFYLYSIRRGNHSERETSHGADDEPGFEAGL